MYIDMKSKPCPKCKRGTFTEVDQDGQLQCGACGNTIHRWQAPTQQAWETYPGEDPFGGFDDR